MPIGRIRAVNLRQLYAVGVQERIIAMCRPFGARPDGAGPNPSVVGIVGAKLLPDLYAFKPAKAPEGVGDRLARPDSR